MFTRRMQLLKLKMVTIGKIARPIAWNLEWFWQESAGCLNLEVGPAPWLPPNGLQLSSAITKLVLSTCNSQLERVFDSVPHFRTAHREFCPHH